MMRKIIASKPVRLICLYVITLLFLMLANPARLPSFFLIIPFAALFFCLYFTVVAVIGLFRSDEDETVIGLKLRRPRLLAAVSAGFPVLLLVLQSVVQLTLGDVIIVLVMFLLVYMYVSRSGVTFLGR